MKQETYIGLESITNIESLINKIKPQTILIVSGKNSYIETGLDKYFSLILKDFNTIIFNNFSTNPKIEDCIKGIDILKNNQIDLIIGVGGGSCIDMSKQINILAAQNQPDIIKIIKDNALIMNKGLPLIAIPTTSGTGSEATHFAVTYINKKKYSIAHTNMLPDYAIIDPKFTYKTSQQLIATCGFDALSQSVESYWSINSTNESKKYASKSMSLIIDNLFNASKGNKEAKNSMSEAAHLSGKAINITKTTAAHAISYPISTYFDIPHGHSVALTLGCFFIINAQITKENILDTRGKEYLVATMNELFKIFKEKDAQGCKKFWYNFMKKNKLETNLTKLGIKSKDDISKIINNTDPIRIINNPVKVDKKIIENIFNELS
ncbi:MAG: phosphonoacetaldehyde reductase [Pelagibacterales bacterium]|nr:phosphonoacetaldehyde reductase [Pelagibacterales bacterium]